jgi:hypothetical protein
MAERIPITYGDLEIPPEYQKDYPDRVRVISRGCGYQIGQLIYILKHADYEIIYNWKGIERRVIKVFKPYIVGSLKPDL